MSDIWFSNDGAMNGGPYHSFCMVFETAEMDVDEEMTWSTIGELIGQFQEAGDYSDDEILFLLEDACQDYSMWPPDGWVYQ